MLTLAAPSGDRIDARIPVSAKSIVPFDPQRAPTALGAHAHWHCFIGADD